MNVQRSSDGTAVGATGTAVSTTRRRAAHDACPGHVPGMLDLLPDAIAIAGRDGTIRAANRAFRMLAARDVVGMRCCDVLGCGTPGASWTECLITSLVDSGARRAGGSTVLEGVPVRVWASDSSDDEIALRLRSTHAERAHEGVPRQRIRVRTLGATTVEGAGDAVADGWLSQRPGLLFKYLLAARGRAPAVDEIADALWPHHGGEGVVTVRQAVFLARRKLGADAVVTSPGTYALDPSALWIDADAFENAVRTGLDAFLSGSRDLAVTSFERALSLYRGEFLADEPYADWATDERERLRALTHIPLRTMAEMRLALGDLAGAAPYVERLGQMEPLDPDIHRLLLQIWIQLGRHSRARRHFELFGARMRRTFGEPLDFDLAELTGRAPLHAI